MKNLVDRSLSESVLQRIKQCLLKAEALNFSALRERTDLAPEVIVSALYRLVHEKKMEVIRPVTLTDPQPITLHPSEHYRLIRPMDQQYRWQNELHRQQAPVPMRSSLKFWAYATKEHYDTKKLTVR